MFIYLLFYYYPLYSIQRFAKILHTVQSGIHLFSRARICKPLKEPRNQFPAWRKTNLFWRISLPEPVFVNLLRSPGIDFQPGGSEWQPYLTYWPPRARICKPFKEPRNQFLAWRASTATLFDVPALKDTYRLAEFIPWNRFLGSLNVYKFGLRLHWLSESILGLLKRLQIRA